MNGDEKKDEKFQFFEKNFPEKKNY